MPFYHYDQNNSGGAFIEPALNVFVEASSSDEANAVAEANGLYFDGIEEGRDCDCCGDRWSRAWRDSLVDMAEVEATLERQRKWDAGFSRDSGVPISLIILKEPSQ